MEEIDEKLINADRHAIKVKDIVSREMLLDAKREILKTLDWTESECDLAIESFYSTLRREENFERFFIRRRHRSETAVFHA